MTHLDAIGHVYWDGMVYNGRLASEVVTRRGLDFASIYAMRDGIFTRGLLLDVASAQGAAWLPPTAYVNRVDLEAAERMAGVRVEAGDAVIVRVAWRLERRSMGQKTWPSERDSQRMPSRGFTRDKSQCLGATVSSASLIRA